MLSLCVCARGLLLTQVGQGAELIAMVGRLEGVGLVVDEKLDMIIERLRKQEENAARLELRLAEYSENMAEVREQTNSWSLLISDTRDVSRLAMKVRRGSKAEAKKLTSPFLSGE